MPSRADAAPSFVYAPAIPPPGERITLSSDEAHYLRRVCRARPGDCVHATDGGGRVALIQLLEPAGVAEVIGVEEMSRSRRAWVCAGPPEGQRADWMIEKLAELGVDTFVPLECERAGFGAAAGRQDRWERLAIAALRQSRRAHRLEVKSPRSLERVLGELPAEASRWLARADGERAGTDASKVSVVFVGPAAGFTPGELALLESAGCRPIRLSDGRLRTETAALAWAAQWSAL